MLNADPRNASRSRLASLRAPNALSHFHYGLRNDLRHCPRRLPETQPVKLCELAQRLLVNEVARDHVAEANAPALALVAEKLRRPLVTLTGIPGFRSLLARGLTLAKAQAPALNIVQI